MTPRLLLLAVATAAAAGPGLAQDVPLVEIDTFWPDATKLGILLAAFLILAFGMWRVRLGAFFRTLAIWGAILVALLAFYTYRQPLERAAREIVAVLLPGTPIGFGDAVMVQRGFGGHFLLKGEVDGTPIDFIFDTGASAVVLTAADAARAGFDVASLDYRIPVMTAAGLTQVASIRIGEIVVGDIRVADVRGAVARAGELEQSLLGNTFLDRLSGYEVRRDRLVLNP